jgi:hypothetical protein
VQGILFGRPQAPKAAQTQADHKSRGGLLQRRSATAQSVSTSSESAHHKAPRTKASLEAIGNMSGVRGGDCKMTPRLLQYQAWLKRKSILLILVLALASRERQ